MKTIEEMNAMEVCAYLVAKTSEKLIGQGEIRRLYDIHCAKLKKEIEANAVKDVSAEFRKELLETVRAEARLREAGEKPGSEPA